MTRDELIEKAADAIHELHCLNSMHRLPCECPRHAGDADHLQAEAALSAVEAEASPTLYTPTTDEVRGGYSASQMRSAFYAGGEEQLMKARAAFDRWLAAHDAEVAAECDAQWRQWADNLPPCHHDPF